jgi:predicted ester cyclase
VVERFWSAFEANEIGDAMLVGWRTAFPNLRHEVVDVVESGDTVAVELVVKGTHEGAMMMPDGNEIPATGREFVWESVEWIKLRDGKIASWRVYQDMVPFLTTLGLMPEAAAAG